MTNRKAKRKATSVPPSNQPTTSEQNPQTAEELLQIIKANPQLYENPNPQILHALRLTIEEYVLLKLCAPGVKPSECTAQQRLLLHQLEKRFLTKLIEYPHLFNGPRWVLADMGEIKLQTLLRTADIPNEPAKVTAIPLRSIRSRR